MSSLAAADSQQRVFSTPKQTKSWSPKFLAEIGQKNHEKRPDAPIALYFTANYNNEDLLTPAFQFFILTIAKTHRVVLRMIEQNSDIQREIASLDKDRIELLVINAHGSRQSMRLSEQNSYDQADPMDFEGLPSRASIFLLSCRTGNGLAQRMSQVLPQTIFAPKQNLNILWTFPSVCPTHKDPELRSYHKGEQHVFQFKHNQSTESCDHSQPDENQYFLKFQEYLYQQYLMGDDFAAFDIGCLYDSCERNVAGAEEEAEKWYEIAATQDNYSAMENLGRLYLKKSQMPQLAAGKDVDLSDQIQRYREKARYWLEKSAAQNRPKSQYYLGIIYTQSGDLENAEQNYSQAANQGLLEAQLALGTLYYKKMKTLESERVPSPSDIREIHSYRKKSYDYYRMAADRENPEAQFYIAHIYERIGKLDKAKKWYRIAAEHGHPEARSILQSLENLSTVHQE